MIPDLIYDVGMNNGDDSAYYISSGYRVVAIEANPFLIEKARRRFEIPISNGRLILLNVGITSSPGRIPFYINNDNSEWSAFDPLIAGRENMETTVVEVEGVPFGQILKQHGVPFYLKTDIERNDIYCLRALQKEDLPAYISVEAHKLEYLCVLHELGYRQFKCVNQRNHNLYHPVDNENLVQIFLSECFRLNPLKNRWLREQVKHRLPWVKEHLRNYRRSVNISLQNQAGKHPYFPPGSSGPFGEDTPGEWQELEQVAYNWLHYQNGKRHRGTLDFQGWYDFHAKL